jgi:two-component system, OmpR family, alkaline phosphatase synthesis response regulator PhoP
MATSVLVNDLAMVAVSDQIQSQQIHLLTQQLAARQAEVEIYQLMLEKVLEELRRPIANMGLAIGMMKRRVATEEVASYLRILDEECLRGCAALNDMAQLQEMMAISQLVVLKKLQAMG